MVLKGSQSDLWVRNVQLSLFFLPGIRPRILLRTLDISILRCFTAVVIKYADKIMKSFATSLSIIISLLASVALFNFSITVPFVVASSIALAATWFYDQSAAEKPRKFHA
ncbi:hypothetical protein FRC04_000606 [Tulasnella sp. 424]|nr:hypothetical protein FRC04_000606 [Tulasnella sp. 424]